jgi:cytochrome c
MVDHTNTIAGWVLGAGIVALGGSILTGEYFRHHPVEKGGYEVADAAPAGGEAAVVELTNFAAGDVAKGAEVFKKCASCHTVTAGGANGIGPNLHGVMGKKMGGVAGFAYSDGVMGMGKAWDFASMDAWLAGPKKFIAGTKMSFAGLGKAADRADLIVYLNAQGSNLPIPAAPVAEAAAAAPAETAAATAGDVKPAAAAPAAAAAK